MPKNKDAMTLTQDLVDRILSQAARPVTDLGLDTRATNCMTEEKIRWIGDLLLYLDAYLLKIPNFGRKSLKHTRERLFAICGLDTDPLKGGMQSRLTQEERASDEGGELFYREYARFFESRGFKVPKESRPVEDVAQVAAVDADTSTETQPIDTSRVRVTESNGGFCVEMTVNFPPRLAGEYRQAFMAEAVDQRRAMISQSMAYSVPVIIAARHALLMDRAELLDQDLPPIKLPCTVQFNVSPVQAAQVTAGFLTRAFATKEAYYRAAGEVENAIFSYINELMDAAPAP